MRLLTTDVAIIGAGTAGLHARREVERAGKSWLLIEAGPYGTTCARTGCMPSKLLIAAAEAAQRSRRAGVFGVQIAWLGLDSNLATNTADLRLSYTGISIVVIVVWMTALALYDTRGHRVIGVGSTEYRLVADASVRVFGFLAIVAFLLHVDLARGYHFPGDARPFAILGARLPLLPREPAPAAR